MQCRWNSLVLFLLLLFDGAVAPKNTTVTRFDQSSGVDRSKYHGLRGRKQPTYPKAQTKPVERSKAISHGLGKGKDRLKRRRHGNFSLQKLARTRQNHGSNIRRMFNKKHYKPGADLSRPIETQPADTRITSTLTMESANIPNRVDEAMKLLTTRPKTLSTDPAVLKIPYYVRMALSKVDLALIRDDLVKLDPFNDNASPESVAEHLAVVALSRPEIADPAARRIVEAAFLDMRPANLASLIIDLLRQNQIKAKDAMLEQLSTDDGPLFEAFTAALSRALQNSAANSAEMSDLSNLSGLLSVRPLTEKHSEMLRAELTAQRALVSGNLKDEIDELLKVLGAKQEDLEKPSARMDQMNEDDKSSENVSSEAGVDAFEYDEFDGDFEDDLEDFVGLGLIDEQAPIMMDQEDNFEYMEFLVDTNEMETFNWTELSKTVTERCPSELTEELYQLILLMRHASRTPRSEVKPNAILMKKLGELSIRQKAVLFIWLTTENSEWANKDFPNFLLSEDGKKSILDVLNEALKILTPAKHGQDIEHVKKLISWWDSVMFKDTSPNRASTHHVDRPAAALPRLATAMVPDKNRIFELINEANACPDEECLAKTVKYVCDNYDVFRAGVVLHGLMSLDLEPTPEIAEVLSSESGARAVKSALSLTVPQIGNSELSQVEIQQFQKVAGLAQKILPDAGASFKDLEESVKSHNNQDLYDAYTDLVNEGPSQSLRVVAAMDILASAPEERRFHLDAGLVPYYLKRYLSRFDPEFLKVGLENLNPFNKSAAQHAVLVHLALLAMQQNLSENEKKHLVQVILSESNVVDIVSFIIDIMRKQLLQPEILASLLKFRDSPIYNVALNIILRFQDGRAYTNEDMEDLRNLNNLLSAFGPLDSKHVEFLRAYIKGLEAINDADFQRELERLIEHFSVQVPREPPSRRLDGDTVIPSNLSEAEKRTASEYLEQTRTELQAGAAINEELLQLGNLTKEIEILRLILVLANIENLSASLEDNMDESNESNYIRTKMNSLMAQYRQQYQANDALEALRLVLDRAILKNGIPTTDADFHVLDQLCLLWNMYLGGLDQTNAFQVLNLRNMFAQALTTYLHGDRAAQDDRVSFPGVPVMGSDFILNSLKASKAFNADIEVELSRLDTLRSAALVNILVHEAVTKQHQLKELDPRELNLERFFSPLSHPFNLTAEIMTWAIKLALPRQVHDQDSIAVILAVVTKMVDIVLDLDLVNRKMIRDLKGPMKKLAMPGFVEQYRRLKGNLPARHSMTLDQASPTMTDARRPLPPVPTARVEPAAQQPLLNGVPSSQVIGEELVQPAMPFEGPLEETPQELVPVGRVRAPLARLLPVPPERIPEGDLEQEPELEHPSLLAPRTPIIPTAEQLPAYPPAVALDIEELGPVQPVPPAPELVPIQSAGQADEGAEPVGLTPVIGPPEEALQGGQDGADVPVEQPGASVGDPNAQVQDTDIPVEGPGVRVTGTDVPEVQVEPLLPVVAREPILPTDHFEPEIPIVPITPLQYRRVGAFSYEEYVRRRNLIRPTVVQIAGVPPSYGPGPLRAERERFSRPPTSSNKKDEKYWEVQKQAKEKKLKHDKTVSYAAMTSVILGFTMMGYAMYELAAFDHTVY